MKMDILSPINNAVSNKRLDRLEEVVKTLSPEGGVLTKEDIAEVAIKAENALKTANTTSNELSTFKTKVSNTYATKLSLSSYAIKEDNQQQDHLLQRSAKVRWQANNQPNSRSVNSRRMGSVRTTYGKTLPANLRRDSGESNP